MLRLVTARAEPGPAPVPGQGLPPAALGLCCMDTEEGKSLRSSREETLGLAVINYSSLMSCSQRLR